MKKYHKREVQSLLISFSIGQDKLDEMKHEMKKQIHLILGLAQKCIEFKTFYPLSFSEDKFLYVLTIINGRLVLEGHKHIEEEGLKEVISYGKDIDTVPSKEFIQDLYEDRYTVAGKIFELFPSLVKVEGKHHLRAAKILF